MIKCLFTFVLIIGMAWAAPNYTSAPSGQIRFVTASGAPAVGISVNITITDPKSRVKGRYTGTTNSNGVVSYTYKLKKGDAKGTWKVDASAVSGGQTYTGSTTFQVQ